MSANKLPKVLLTGFQPFADDPVNPSWLAVSALPEVIEGVSVNRVELPVEWFASLDALEAKIKEVQPDILLMVGLAAGRNGISLERVGVNLCECSIPDNAGTKLFNTPIYTDGPNAYFSTLPFEKMKAALDEAGIPNHYSLTAGAFICNHILYGSLHMSATKYPQMKCLFVHVPATPDIAKEGMFSMEVETIAKALELCVSAAVKDWKENH